MRERDQIFGIDLGGDKMFKMMIPRRKLCERLNLSGKDNRNISSAGLVVELYIPDSGYP